jgi:hypothetical protein
MRERNPAKTSTDDQHAGDKQHAIPGAPQAVISIARGFAPSVCGQQATCWCGRENVVIQLEAGDAEKTKDHDRPEPAHAFPDLERLVPSKPLEGVEATPSDNCAPWKECSGEGADIERVIDGSRREFDGLSDVPQIASEEISLHELVAKSPLHPDEPG